MLKRFIVLIVIFTLVVIALLRVDLVHSDPGLPIEDFPLVFAAMAFLSWPMWRGRLHGWRVAVPSAMIFCMAIGSWMWAQSQYQKAASLSIEGVSLAFPGLYFPKDSWRYTYTALAETERPHDEVEREILSGLRARGVRVSALRVHF